jgi:hypothetical protein
MGRKLNGIRFFLLKKRFCEAGHCGQGAEIPFVVTENYMKATFAIFWHAI